MEIVYTVVLIFVLVLMLLYRSLWKETCRRHDRNDIIDQFVEDLDFDNIIAWSNFLKIEKVNYPPIDDMYPDWEDELRVDVGDAMRNISKKGE